MGRTGVGAVVVAIAALNALTACGPTSSGTAAPSVSLDCEDGVADPRPIPPQLLLTDRVGAALQDVNTALPNAADVGIPVPSNEEWKFRKAPLLLQAGAGTVTLEVPDDGRQYLFWTSADDWTGDGATAEDRRRWTATRATAQGCDGLTASFYGGLLVRDPARCFPLSIAESGRPETLLTIRGDGQACSASRP